MNIVYIFESLNKWMICQRVSLFLFLSFTHSFLLVNAHWFRALTSGIDACIQAPDKMCTLRTIPAYDSGVLRVRTRHNSSQSLWSYVRYIQIVLLFAKNILLTKCNTNLFAGIFCNASKALSTRNDNLASDTSPSQRCSHCWVGRFSC